MTTLEARNEKRGFFSIYKKGQGKWVRWCTVAAFAIATIVGAVWLVRTYFSLNAEWVWAMVVLVWVLLWGWLTFWMVNSPKMAEFLIMTESEMRKVTWPSRREVVNSTKVIILLTVLLGVLLWLVDMGFVYFFDMIKLTSK